MIELKNISMKFSHRNIEINNLKIPENKITLIKGLSGSGKSTLLYKFALISRETNYKYIYHEKNLMTLSSHQKAYIRRYCIGYVFQDFGLFENMNIYECFQYYCRLANIKDTKENLLQLLKKVHIENPLNQSIQTLSGGEKQRLAIAYALIKEPEILILDEPTSALDEINEREVFELLQEILKNENCTIIFASHSYIADEYADMIYALTGKDICEIKHSDDCLQQEEKSYKKEMSFIWFYIKHNFISEKSMNLLMIFILIMGCFGVFGIQHIIQQSLDSVDARIAKISDCQLMIESNDTIYTLGDYNSASPIDEQIVNDISKQKGIIKIYPYYDLKVQTRDQEIRVYPLYKENNLTGKLYQTFQEARQLYPSYHSVYQDLDGLNKNPSYSNFIFNNTVHINKEISISGIMSIGRTTAYNHDLDYMLMDYDELVSLAQQANVLPIKNAYNIFCKNIDAVNDIETYIAETYPSIHINTTFQDTTLLINMKYQTMNMFEMERIVTILLITTLFVYMCYWMMKRREKELMILMANGVMPLELIGILAVDVILKIFVSFVFTILIVLIVQMNILFIHTNEILYYFGVMFVVLIFGSLFISAFMINHLNPEKVFRN